jgi:hypothetical protein
MEHERKRLEAMEECVEYLSMLLAEIDSLCDWPMYYDMLCAVDTAKGEECESYE